MKPAGMLHALFLILFFPPIAQAQTTTKTPTMLAPNAIFSLEFPDLPETFFVKKTGAQVSTQLTVQLPSNYTADRKFPLFVFLGGGDGGKADAAMLPRFIAGDADFICVTLPLFKAEADPKTPAKPLELSPEFSNQIPSILLPVAGKLFATSRAWLIGPDDYDAVAPAYTEMLKKLNETIPNIDPDKSILAGFSNGAHAISVLLAKADPVTLRQFHSFAMVEGGVWLPFGRAGALGEPLKGHRCLFVYSDVSGPGDDLQAIAFRPFIYNATKNFVDAAKGFGFDFTFATIHGGHHFGPAEVPTVMRWAREELRPAQ